MKISVFSAKPYDREFLGAAFQAQGHEAEFFEGRLNPSTASLARGSDAVCAFVNDVLDAATLRLLAAAGVRLIALRCAGFNQVDLAAAAQLKIPVVRVPAYSPYAVAEHAVALLLGVVRHLPRACNRVREGNFELTGLLGFDLHGKRVGVLGTGKIGAVFARIMRGFGCEVMATDQFEQEALREIGVHYVPQDQLLRESDILSLHCPLTPETKHLVNAESLARMKRGVVIINTSRGALADARALLAGLKSGHIGALGMDVYEEEAALFFEDKSDEIIKDDLFMRLTTFPNVILTGHQAFFTREALTNIAETTALNISAFARGEPLANEVKPAP